MPGRTIAESIKIRDWIVAALGVGCENPSQVLEWIEQRKDRKTESPTLSTIGRIMREMGYHPTSNRWEKANGD
jgi:hypothetical protein